MIDKVFLQERTDPKKLDEYLRAKDLGWVYIGTDTVWRVLAERIITARRLSFADRMDEFAKFHRQEYIDLIGRLSQINHMDSPFLWWSSELAAKNPYNNLYTRICLAKMARDVNLIEDDFCVVVQSDKAQISRTDRADALPIIPGLDIVSGRYNQYVTSRVDYRNKILGEFWPEPIPMGGEKSVLFVTWADERNVVSGIYRDPFFGDLIPSLKNKGYDVALLPRVLYNADFKKLISDINGTKEKVYFPEQFVDRKDLKKAMRMANAFSPIVPVKSSVGGVIVNPFIDVVIKESMGYHSKSLLYGPMIKKMADMGVVPERVYYPCEGHAWETALVYSVRKYMPGTKIVAWDNGTFSQMTLSMFPAKNEFLIRPLPDKIVTSGKMYAETLLNNGYPARMVRAGCGLRHKYITGGAIPERCYFGAEYPMVLVATSIDFNETVEMIFKSIAAFKPCSKNSGYNYLVFVKLHPMIDTRRLIECVGDLPWYVEISRNKTIRDLIRISDVLLYTYSTVCFEGLAHGTYPIFVKSENGLNMDKLDGLDIGGSASAPDDIRRLADNFLSLPDEKKRDWNKHAREICGLALGDVDEDCIKKFIE